MQTETLTATVPAGRSQFNALLALVLLVPAPFLGTWFGLFSPETRGTPLGQAIYAAAKIWILVLPLVWLFAVDKGKPSWSPPRRGGFGIGIASGLAISAAILAGWFWIGQHWVDLENARATAQAAGIGEPARFALFAVYIFTINAVLEEYVWRWFVYRKAEDFLGKAGLGAVVLSALLFTLHHVVALAAQFDWLPVLLASLGVFIGGCVWSGLYLKYRSIWPGFVSHAIVDVAIFVVGAHILFF